MDGDDDRLAAEAAHIEAAQRDPTRFDVLYEDTFDAVFAFVAKRVPNRGDVEDITSVVFQKALAALPSYEWRGVPFLAWLLRIAANEISRGRRPSGGPLSVDPPVDDQELADVERRATIFRLLRVLPPEQRQVLVLRFAHDRSLQQVATTLGRSEGAIKQLQYRALQTLRRQQGGSDG
jgi:RNA polymerase sigma-70 factor (ECF subfamily)